MKIPPPVYGLAALLSMVMLHKHVPVTCTDASWPKYVGWGLVASGLALDLISVLYFRKAKTTINPLRPENTSSLVTGGPYQISRNPMYLGMALMLIGAALILRCLTPILMPWVFCLVVTWLQIMPEEKTLEAIFNGDYREYKNQVARWV